MRIEDGSMSSLFEVGRDVDAATNYRYDLREIDIKGKTTAGKYSKPTEWVRGS